MHTDSHTHAPHTNTLAYTTHTRPHTTKPTHTHTHTRSHHTNMPTINTHTHTRPQITKPCNNVGRVPRSLCLSNRCMGVVTFKPRSSYLEKTFKTLREYTSFTQTPIRSYLIVILILAMKSMRKISLHEPKSLRKEKSFFETCGTVFTDSEKQEPNVKPKEVFKPVYQQKKK